MSHTFMPWDVDQDWLFPPSLHELVPAGHVAHFVRELVRDELDLSAVLDDYRGGPGAPAFHPTMMTALLLYACTQGVYSSRKIARACEQRLDFMAVTALAKPEWRTIAEFRQRHRTALRGLFVQILRLCRQAGLVKLGHVALDGTKVRANASRHTAMSYERMVKRETELEAEVKAWFAEAEEADAAEDAALGADRRGDELPEWVANKQRRLETIRAAKAALEAEAAAGATSGEAAPPALTKPVDEPASEPREPAGAALSEPPAEPPEPPAAPASPPPRPAPKSQRNFTDPESRIMKTHDGWQQCYNPQAAVDAESQIIVATYVTNRGTDRQEMLPLLDQIAENLGQYPGQASADNGYYSDANVRGTAERGVEAYVATGRQRHGTPSATGDPPTRESQTRAAMRAKLQDEGWGSPYHLRKQTVEPVFGQIKAARGFRQFLTRGLEKVEAEWQLVCCAHNLLKLAQFRLGS
jgi:transposase